MRRIRPTASSTIAIIKYLFVGNSEVRWTPKKMIAKPK
jgi:hypothetical protein